MLAFFGGLAIRLVVWISLFLLTPDCVGISQVLQKNTSNHYAMCPAGHIA